MLRLPVTGRVARGLNTARFSRTLSILTASSVPLLEGIQTAAAVSANRYVEQQLLLAADRVREGSSLRAALAELRLFPPMMLYMIASGEQSGELETMLEARPLLTRNGNLIPRWGWRWGCLVCAGGDDGGRGAVYCHRHPRADAATE